MNVQMEDALPAFLRMVDPKDFQELNGFSPTMLDDFGDIGYSDAIASQANPLSSSSNMDFDNLQRPRGAHKIRIVGVGRAAAVGDPVGAGTLLRTDAAQETFVDCQVDLLEPLMVSPFMWGKEHNAAGVVGVQNISVVCSIDQSMKRFFSSGNLLNGASYRNGKCNHVGRETGNS